MAPQASTHPRRTAGCQPVRNASPDGKEFDWTPVHNAIDEEANEGAPISAPSNMATQFATPTPSVQVQDAAQKQPAKKALDIARFFRMENVADGNSVVKKRVCQLCKYVSESERVGGDVNHTTESLGRNHPLIPFTQDGLVDALINFIVADDQSIHVVECCKFCDLLLYMWDNLKDEDIPHQTKVTASIMKAFKKYFQNLIKELDAALREISFTADLWSSKTCYPYSAVTTHWMSCKDPLNMLTMCSSLITFHRVWDRHSGDRLARIALNITDRAKITGKMGHWMLDNASANDSFMEGLEKGQQIDNFKNTIKLGNEKKWFLMEVLSKSAKSSSFATIAADCFISVTTELEHLKMTSMEWSCLEDIVFVLGLPHAIQMTLNAEKMPTLGSVIPQFELFMTSLKEVGR
ncbi:hypothetical protein H0H81_004003 [Sphagnurus paluster]|uniref:Uncharacterized protein n=1 Tax=Sphagnurus paluster TaxID=117069 RepID=A0A9P7FLP0_9AGAR|nr:hypothetical protein H0H81_004003 [Sphagnurus paluster]